MYKFRDSLGKRTLFFCPRVILFRDRSILLRKKAILIATLLKLLLAILAGSLGYWQLNEMKTVPTVFCFILSALIFLGFLLDLFRLVQKKLQPKAPAKTEVSPAPAPGDYQDSPDLADLKIGHTFRLEGVNGFIQNIVPVLEETPEYGLSESELIDRYLTDKKIWKYCFHSKPVTLQKGTLESGQDCIRALMGGRQIGFLSGPQAKPLVEAKKAGSQVEVVYCSIGGGPYKVVSEDVSTGQYNLKTGETGYSVTLSIYVK